MEKIPYEEAREWFWIRTALWFVPAFIVSVMGYFEYAGSEISTFKTRMLVSLVCGLAVSLLGLIAAIVSMQFPWMRLGWRRLWWFNALVCVIFAGFLAAGGSAVVLSVLRENPANVPGSYVIRTAHSMMAAGIAGAAFWGAAFGSWFALRFDRYFVESI